MRASRVEYQEIRSREEANKQFYTRPDGVSAPPHTLCISVNNQCAFKCQHCDVGIVNRAKDNSLIGEKFFSSRYQKTGEFNLFPLDRIKDLVDEMAPHGPIIKTNLMEPLLYPDLPEVAKYIKDAGLKFHTLTNGWKLKQAAEWLVEYGTDLIRISVDGPPQVHDDVRGVPGSFDRCMAGIEALIEEKRKRNVFKPIIGVCYTISDLTYEHIVAFMDELDSRGLLAHVYVNFNHLMYTTQWEIDKTLEIKPDFDHMRPCSMDGVAAKRINPERLQGLIQEIYKRYSQDDYHYYFSPWLKEEDLRDFYNPDTWMFKGTPCYIPWYSAQVEINGDLGIFGHCILPTLGNIMERGFMDVWNSQEATKIRRDLKDHASYAACNRCLGTMFPLRGRD